MDPTEIVVVPIPLSRLVRFVGVSVLVFLFVSVPWWKPARLFSSIKNLSVTMLVMLAIAILCGAHPQHNIQYTLLASFYIAALLCLNPSVFEHAYQEASNLLLFNNNNKTATTKEEQMALVRSYTALLMMIPFQILNILDSGLQVQRWPLPMILGATSGWLLGTVIGLVWVIALYHSKSNVGKDTHNYEDLRHPKNI